MEARHLEQPLVAAHLLLPLALDVGERLPQHVHLELHRRRLRLRLLRPRDVRAHDGLLPFDHLLEVLAAAFVELLYREEVGEEKEVAAVEGGGGARLLQPRHHQGQLLVRLLLIS